MEKLRSYKLTFIICLIIQGFLNAQEVPFDQKHKNEFLDELISSLNTHYVLETKGLMISNQLEQEYKNGKYDSITDIEYFKEIINRDLYRFSHDRHLVIDVIEPKPKNKDKSNIKKKNPPKLFNTKKIDKEIGYLKFDHFPRLNDDTAIEIDKAMHDLIDSKAIIIDLRDNSGGSEEFVNYLLAHFFESETLVAKSYSREKESKNVIISPEKTKTDKFQKTPLYILISKSTFSAAEVFAYRLQQFNRAIVVGDSSLGGAHRVMTYLINEQLLMDLPYEGHINVVNNMNIEGVGVKPNINSHYNLSLPTAVKHFYSKSKMTNQKPIDFWNNRYDFNQKQLNKTGHFFKLIQKTINETNTKSEKRLQKFGSKYVSQESSQNIVPFLLRFVKVWSHLQIKDIYYIDNKTAQVILETAYGIKQFKIILNSEGKIEQIMSR